MLKELGSIARNRNIDGYKSMPKDKLLRIINNNKKKNRNSIFKSKRGNKKVFMSQQKIVFLNRTYGKLKRVFTCQQKKKLFKTKIKEIIKILYDSTKKKTIINQ